VLWERRQIKAQNGLLSGGGKVRRRSGAGVQGQGRGNQKSKCKKQRYKSKIEKQE
jgi:hypothetical protein